MTGCTVRHRVAGLRIQGRLEHLFNSLPGGTGRKEWVTITNVAPVNGTIVSNAGIHAFLGTLEGPVEFTISTGAAVRRQGARVLLSGPVPVPPS